MAVPERVVISGAGCCTALGHDLDGVARSLREGRDAFRASGALEGLSVCPAEDWGQDEARQQFEGSRQPCAHRSCQRSHNRHAFHFLLA